MVGELGTFGSKRFRIVRRLGSGGMGVVYEAIDEDGARVALKTLKTAEPQALPRLTREHLLLQTVSRRRGLVQRCTAHSTCNCILDPTLQLLHVCPLPDVARPRRIRHVDQLSQLALRGFEGPLLLLPGGSLGRLRRLAFDALRRLTFGALRLLPPTRGRSLARREDARPR